MTRPAHDQQTTTWALAILSAATLAFEINLTRLFSVAQFYHFAFMVVSLALLGFGASGTFLTLFARLRTRDPARVLIGSSWGFALTALGAYLLTLYLPFDSFRIAHDARQGLVLALHYLALAAPFFCSGAAVGLLLAAQPEQSSRTYAANMAGSAAGCLLAIALPSLVGGEGTVLLSAVLGIVAALVCAWGVWRRQRIRPGIVASATAQAVLALLLLFASVRLPTWLAIRLSPYKGLSYALLYPDAEPIFRRWNGFSRVDVVRSAAIRSLPGSGFRCTGPPPSQLGLTVDGDDLSPISHVAPGFSDLPFTDCLLTALPYRLRPGAQALILEPRGGFDLLVALAEGAQAVTAVEANPLVVEAVRQQGDWAGALYDDPRVRVVVQEERSYARRSPERYDVVALALTRPQRAVVSGAYSLGETYAYTLEAFADYLDILDENGLLVVTRWLQVPPSESIRAFALAVEAVERAGGDPQTSIVALRSYQQMLILVRRGPFTGEELERVRAFAAPRAFDLVYLPGIRPDEVNRYNVLPEPDYYNACVGLLEAADREAWYRAYPFDVRPPTDDHPFFDHFFKWQQAAEVWAMAGRTWQPFGGAGYFVPLALLALALLAAGVLILLPLGMRWHRAQVGRATQVATTNQRLKSLLRTKAGRTKVATTNQQRNLCGHVRRARPWGATLAYFACLGLGYLCVEIPLLQRFILFLGQPTFAMAAVLFALLLFSGVGSLISGRIPLWVTLILVPALVGGYALGLPALFDATLAAPLGVRLLVAVVALAPPGLAMGMPFPKGIALLQDDPALIAWAWGSNGAASVVASILAALLALSWGFSIVLVLGATCYAGAWIAARTLP